MENIGDTDKGSERSPLNNVGNVYLQKNIFGPKYIYIISGF